MLGRQRAIAVVSTGTGKAGDDSVSNTFLCLLRATQIKTYSWDNAQVILVGNKCDMEEERVVPTEKGRLLAEQLGMYMTSVCACVYLSG